jgi:hypothetical protein
MGRLAWVALVFAVGCGGVCGHSNACAVEGQPPDLKICDGSDYRSCGDGNRGQAVSCVHGAQQAVCTLEGWTFQPASPAPADGGR